MRADDQPEKEKRKGRPGRYRRFRVFTWALIVAMGTVGAWVTMAPVSRQNAQDELDAAQAKWTAQHITSYRMTIEVYGLVLDNYYRFTVQGGEVINAEQYRSLTDDPPYPLNFIPYEPADADTVASYTVESLFALAERTMSKQATETFFIGPTLRFRILYAETLGYIKKIFTTACDPWETRVISSNHCSLYVLALDFEPLADE